MTEWKETTFSDKPEAVIPIGPDLYMQTRNVRHVSDEMGYMCETREVTESELKLLNEITELERIVTNTNIRLLSMT